MDTEFPGGIRAAVEAAGPHRALLQYLAVEPDRSPSALELLLNGERLPSRTQVACASFGSRPIILVVLPLCLLVLFDWMFIAHLVVFDFARFQH